MCPRPVVVVDVLRQNLSKMPFANHDDVVQAFTSNRADHPLGIRVLPRRAGRNDGLLDVQHPGLMRKSFSIDLVSVPNQIPGPLLQRARLEQLARRPFGGRMLRDIKMHQPTPAGGQHYEPDKSSSGGGRCREDSQPNEIRGVVLQECPPCVRRRPPRPGYVLRHRRLRDRQAELQQLAVDPRRTPQRIRAAHLPYQIPQVPPNCWPTPSASTLPCPVPSKSLPVPANHRLRPHHLQRMPPARPHPRQQNPEDPAHPRQPRPRLARLPHGGLPPQRQVLQRQLAVRANRGSQCPDEDSKPSDHDWANSLIRSKSARESRRTSS